MLGIVLYFTRGEKCGSYRSAKIDGEVSKRKLAVFVSALEDLLALADRLDRSLSKEEIWGTVAQLRNNVLYGFIEERLVCDLIQTQLDLAIDLGGFLEWRTEHQVVRESRNVMNKLAALLS